MKRAVNSLKLAIFAVAVALVATACGGGQAVAKIQQVPADKAMVTFVRATAFGGAIKFDIWDGEEHVAVLGPKKLVQYVTSPGEHLFLASSAENWSYVKANLEAGKSYYVVTNVTPGVTVRAVLRPVKQGDAEYTQATIDGWKAKLAAAAIDPAVSAARKADKAEKLRAAVEAGKAGSVDFATLDAADFYN